MSARRYCFLLVALFITEGVTATAASVRETLTFGVFAYRPDHIIRERYEPLAQYLSEEAGVDIHDRVVRKVAAALFAVEPQDQAAVAAGITGFSPPADYQSVDYLARTLPVPPYDQTRRVTWADVLNQYRAGAFTIVVLVFLLFGGALWLARSKRQLAVQQKRLKQLIQDWPQPALLIRNGVFVNTNRAAVDLLKYTSNTSLFGKSLEAFSPEVQPDGQISRQKMEQILFRVKGGQVEQREWMLHRSDKSEVWVDMTLAPVQGEEEAGPVILCSLYDITRRKRAEQRQRLAASVFDHSREAIFITDSHGMVIEANDAYLEITGWPQSRAIGRLPPLPVEEGSGVFSSARTQGFWSGEFPCKHLIGGPRVLAVTISSVCDDHGGISHFVGMFSDISRLKEQEQKLTIMAHYDALTGLPNRVLFSDRLQQAMALTRRQGSKLAVVYIDLDEFKPVNDAFGHEAGDQLLIEVAARMRAVLREEDTLARLGGDEFAAIVTNVHQETSLEGLLERLLNQVAEPVWVAFHNVEVSASIGYTLFPQAEDLDGDQLLRQADQAMYEAKHRGRNCYIRFSAPSA